MATGNKTRVKTVRQQLWHRLDGVWDTNEITSNFVPQIPQKQVCHFLLSSVHFLRAW